MVIFLIRRIPRILALGFGLVALLVTGCSTAPEEMSESSQFQQGQSVPNGDLNYHSLSISDCGSASSIEFLNSPISLRTHNGKFEIIIADSNCEVVFVMKADGNEFIQESQNSSGISCPSSIPPLTARFGISANSTSAQLKIGNTCIALGA